MIITQLKKLAEVNLSGIQEYQCFVNFHKIYANLGIISTKNEQISYMGIFCTYDKITLVFTLVFFDSYIRNPVYIGIIGIPMVGIRYGLRLPYQRFSGTVWYWYMGTWVPPLSTTRSP